MKTKRNYFGCASLLAIGFAVLPGCATQKQMYQWDGYQQQVYEYFKGTGNPEEQIAKLEESVQKARSKGAALPPGFHAHLGLLYAKVGKQDQLVQELETEKTLFPESVAFMDFLLKKPKSGGQP